MVTAALIARASAGDNDAFRDLTEPYRRELKVHCYRVLGSLQDAEDALQDTLLTAWRSLGGFEGRASIRTWLYRIATSRCLNALRTASRRPARAWDIPGVEPPEPSAFGEVAWLEPFPDALLAGATDVPPGPEARYEQREAISLAFVTALQLLPARQLAVLILRDVLGYHAHEVAEMLDTTVESVNSALKRARASLQQRLPPTGEREPPPAHDSPAEQLLVEKFVRAYASADIDARPCSRTTSASPCRRFRTSITAAMPLPACTRDSSARAAPMSSFRREQMVSRNSGPTFAPPTGSATRPALPFSPSPAIGSPLSRVSRTACSPGSICRRRSMIKRSARANRTAADLHRIAITDNGWSHIVSRDCTSMA